MGAVATTTQQPRPDERWVAVFHKVNGWMEAPEGAYFRANGERWIYRNFSLNSWRGFGVNVLAA